MIPKRLIVTHVAEHHLESKLRYCLERMKALHPDWEYLFFSDGDCRDFISDHAPEFAELYDWYPQAVMRADLFRLLAVHRLGGFYLDTDMLIEEKLDPLLKHSAVFSIEEQLKTHYITSRFPRWMWKYENDWSLANYAFAAEKEHPFVGAILEELITRSTHFEAEDCTSSEILHSTGPEAVTTVYFRNLEKWSDVTVLKTEGCRFGPYGKHLVHSIWWDGI